MGKLLGGGGGYDTSGMTAATKEATQLQRDIYEDTKTRSEPWYQAGVSGVNRLSDLLGLSGGGSMQSREQIYNQLLPQYTSGSQKSALPEITPDTGTGSSYFNALDKGQQDYLRALRPDLFKQNVRGLEMLNWASPQELQTVLGGYSQPQQSIDYAGLNAAVDQKLSGQQTPEGFGSLMENFDMSKFQEDPGYKFRQEQGEKALSRAMAAKGKTMTPEALKALSEFNSGLASQEYGDAYNRYNNDRGTIYNMLAGVSGVGQNANNQIASAGQQYATNVNNLNMGLANAQAQAAQAKASQPSLFSQLLGMGAQFAMGTYGGKGWTF